MSDEDLGFTPTKADSLPARTSEASGRKRSAPPVNRARQEPQPEVKPEAATLDAAMRAYQAARKLPDGTAALSRIKAKAVRETGEVFHRLQQGMQAPVMDANALATTYANDSKNTEKIRLEMKARTDPDFARLLKQSKK